MILTFLELAYMVDATRHDGVGWYNKCISGCGESISV